MKVFERLKPVVFLVVGFLLLFFFYKNASAEETSFVEIGPTFTGEFNGGLGLVYTERLYGRFDVGAMWISDQDFSGRSTPTNAGIMGKFVAERPDSFWKILPHELHLGAAYWVDTDDRVIGCNLGFALHVRYYLTDKLHAGISHWSNGGSCTDEDGESINRGQDLLVIGFRF